MDDDIVDTDDEENTSNATKIAALVAVPSLVLGGAYFGYKKVRSVLARRKAVEEIASETDTEK